MMLVCQGRALRNGRSVGPTCGMRVARDQRETRGQFLTRARVGGWRIGHRADGTPDALCPTCAKPDPVLVRLTQELARSV